MTTLLIAEHDGANLSDATARAASAARQIGGPIDILVAGKDVRPVADVASRLAGAARVLLADADCYADGLAEPLAALVAALAAEYSHIVLPATTNGKNVAPRIAALLDVMQVSDVIAIVSEDTFERPIYAGNAIQKVQSNDPIKILTIRTTAFSSVEAAGPAPIAEIGSALDPGLSRFLRDDMVASERPELTSARIVVSGGRGLGSRENFDCLILPLADRLDAAAGASRAAVDAGYASNDWQVGQTGKIVAPELYIAVGISGAIQHLAGMKDSKLIVAINKDEDAPIFKIADIGLVGDLFEVLPALTSALG